MTVFVFFPDPWIIWFPRVSSIGKPCYDRKSGDKCNSNVNLSIISFPVVLGVWA